MDSTVDNLEQKEQAGYGLEVLCASWTPLTTAIGEPVEACHGLVTELAAADAESFLASFYRTQQG